jgi:hypothetical protein
MSFLYETHLHTEESSACAVSPAQDYIAPYKDLGYRGIFVTDHFFRANTAVDRSLPWRKWVDRFCRGYEAAREEGARRGLDVFFGWEETFEGDDYLVYGLDREWLLAHPEAAYWTRLEQIAAVRQAGGCVIQAHPFRQHRYISRVILSPYCVDGVEAANSGNANRSYDSLAMRYAQKLKLPAAAGSDIHRASDVCPGEVFGILLEGELHSAADYARLIREKAPLELKIPPGRCDYQGTEKVRIPLEIHNARDKRTRQSLKQFLA